MNSQALRRRNGRRARLPAARPARIQIGSALYSYLTATGAEASTVVVMVHGQKIELDLGRLGDPHTEQPLA